MKQSILRDKCKVFALRIIKLARYLRNEQKEYNMSDQIFRSGTSIGANASEGYYGQSNADMAAKFSIALKESAETEYWLELLYESDLISQAAFTSLHDDLTEIMKLTTAAIKTLKSKPNA